jgi:hypothetical protein
MGAKYFFGNQKGVLASNFWQVKKGKQFLAYLFGEPLIFRSKKLIKTLKKRSNEK